MTTTEAKTQVDRIARFEKLDRLYSETLAAITAITAPDKDGPCGQGPFTGNTRESRHIMTLHIGFSATRGGAPPVEDFWLNDLHIEAWEFSRNLLSQLEARKKQLLAEMEAI